MVREAADARRSKLTCIVAWVAVIAYNIVGLGDIGSTLIGLELGVAEEANPLMRSLMDNIGTGWITAKLLLQGLISFMVIWFPHWIVVSMFVIATFGNALVVFNNLAISGLV